MSDEAKVLQVELEILGYMVRYPDAADTEEHIRNWWLHARDIEQGWGAVTSALQMLEQNELIEHVELPDKRIVYRLRRSSLSPNQGEERE